MPWRIAGWRPHASNGIQPDPTIDSLSINNELITEEGAIMRVRQGGTHQWASQQPAGARPRGQRKGQLSIALDIYLDLESKVFGKLIWILFGSKI